MRATPEEISSSPATIRSLAQPHTSRWCSSATRSIRIWFGNLRDFDADIDLIAPVSFISLIVSWGSGAARRIGRVRQKPPKPRAVRPRLGAFYASGLTVTLRASGRRRERGGPGRGLD